MALKGALPLKKAMVEFNPPPGISISGNPNRPPHSKYERGLFRRIQSRCPFAERICVARWTLPLPLLLRPK